MKRRFRAQLAGFGAAVGALVASACAPDPTSRELRLATLNVRNLDASSSVDKRSTIAEIIARTRADIVLLEEVQGRAALDQLATEPLIAERFAYRAALPGNDSRGFGLGLLSRLRPGLVTSHADETFSLEGTSPGPRFRYTRDCLEAHFDWDGLRLGLLGVHFRAKLDDDPEQRLAEAEYTRNLADDLLGEDPELLLAVLGDFNDVPGSAPLETLAGAGQAKLTSVAAVLPEAERYSLPWETAQDGGVLFDDLLVSTALWRVLRADSVTILHDHDLPEDLRWVTDHAPVAATFARMWAE